MKCRKTFIKCIRHNNEKSNGEILEFKSYLGDQIKAGEIYLGYDLNTLNLDSENSLFLDGNKNRLPDVILVKKKVVVDIKGKQLKRLNQNPDKKNKKKGNDEDNGDMKAFIEEIYEDKNLKDNLVDENEEKNKKEDGKEEKGFLEDDVNE